MAEDKKALSKNPADVTFDNILKQLEEQNAQTKAIKETAQYTQKLQEKLKDQNVDLSSNQRNALMNLVNTLQGNKFDDLEARKEANDTAKKTLELLGEIAENTEPKATADDVTPAEGGGVILAGLLGGIGVAISGLATGLILGIGDIFKAYGRIIKNGVKRLSKILRLDVGFRFIGDAFKTRFANAGKSIGDTFKGIQKSIQTFFKPLTNGIKNARLAFSAGFNGLKTFRTVTGQFGKLGFFGTIGKTIGGFVTMVQKGLSFFTKPVKAIGNAFKQIKNFFGVTTKAVGGITKGTSVIGKTLGNLGRLFGNVFKVFAGIGRTVGRLFLPLTIALSIFDTFKGAIDGFVNTEGSFFEKAIGGLIGGLKGLLVGLVAYPLDLLKNGVAWLLGKLGFENLAEILQTFSFKELIGGLFDKLKNLVLGFFDAMKDDTGSFDFKKVLKVLVGSIFNTLTLPIRLLLEGLAKLAEKIPVKGDDIAAGIREFKGKLKMDTGIDESVAKIEKKAAAKESGQELNDVSREVDEGKSAVNTSNLINTVVGGSTSNRGGDTIIISDSPNPDMISASLDNR